ncbi:hypothetical protein [Leptospira terpstrae]|uniref:Uncharacterized protein n=1 Tax=Leptospira terpstrae serovar Hualin str. LT 11-33 = ATCC 700639 TaxID=1257025 RepID=N1VZ51_9LEPT|nr:hypothetical protein [Leptospira terpstrae]EMY62037.1 hypothetical protein LEP1GSC203_3684 [Leptospira terpstrae serovar Hualin str. LT 11-33 = ATCC 700639]
MVVADGANGMKLSQAAKELGISEIGLNSVVRDDSFLPLFIYFNCTNPFEIKVIKEADAPDFLHSENKCNRSGLRILLIEELVLADIFGGLDSMRENAKKYHSKIVLSYI